MPKRIGRSNNYAAKEAFDEFVEHMEQFCVDEHLRKTVARTEEEQNRMLDRALASRDRAWESFQRAVAELVSSR